MMITRAERWKARVMTSDAVLYAVLTVAWLRALPLRVHRIARARKDLVVVATTLALAAIGVAAAVVGAL